MAGTVTFTYDDASSSTGHGTIQRIICAWTANANSAVGTTAKISGQIIKVITDPIGGPAANYDIVITDEESVDILAASSVDLLNRHTANTEVIYCNLDDGAVPIAAYPVVNDTLLVTVSNETNNKSGEIIIYWQG